MKPEELKDGSGTWIRRDVFVDRFIEEEEEELDRDRVERILDEMIEDGPMRNQMVEDTEYVQLASRTSAMQAMANYKVQSMKNKATDVLGGAKRFRD